MSTRRVTISDVARTAGVSATTVSFVLNDKQGVAISQITRHRVLEAARTLGYRPNAFAKNLGRRGASSFIGLVSDSIATTPFAGQLVKGAQDEAWRRGYVLLVTNTDGDRDVEARALAMMAEHHVTGVLYSTWYHHRVDPPAGLGELPHVLVNCYAEGSDVPAVVPDEVQGGRTATELLLRAGHRRIAFLNSTEEAPATVGRLAGYRQALAEHGVRDDSDLVMRVGYDQESGHAGAQALLALADPPSAVFCYNDRVAMGLYDALRERGLRVPQDLAVVGFDNQEVIAGHLRPPLTTVALPHYEIGQEAVRVLLGDVPISKLDGAVYRVACPPVLRESL